MPTNFPLFSASVHQRFRALSDYELYTVDLQSDLFEVYLESFPEGTNPIFRKRTEHDCSCCKNFIRNLGNLVTLREDGGYQTIWDVSGLPEPYDTVAATLAERVRQAPISGIYRTKQPSYGAEVTRELTDEGGVINWHHFHGSTSNHQCSEPEAVKGRAQTAAQVFRRGLEELSADALDTVRDLIENNSIYRGHEHQRSLLEFIEFKTRYNLADPAVRNVLVWSNYRSRSAALRNTVIGSLVQDLSDGVDVDRAVRSFEAKVAPANYQRPKAVITPKMVESAMSKLRELGLEKSVERRYGRIEWLWNSRNGVTPFCCYSADQSEMMSHVDWDEDAQVMNYIPPVGTRIFASHTKASALDTLCEREEAVGRRVNPSVKEAVLSEILRSPRVLVVDEELHAQFRLKSERPS